MGNEENRRETGARKYPANTDPDPSDRFSQAAANNQKPRNRFGLTRKQGEVEDKTHQSEGQNPAGRTTSSPATAAKRSKHPKATKGIRQSGVHIKD
ncbi:conserved hypothetical protein [Mesorhizobium sp. ORS 3324]|nr:conserved hypothetical protein [Mesorhizobium sp. ORS 3324]